ncbi:MBL fold metallo-hydrolase [Actinocorallia sp. A-T 12471]|uniref:MBL fold metallo-hydrolase n=1 Tax=Actinocorallia sp. A-T 12471 TaxID=3089813 RepID=UPI0029CD16AC|nr:MBL fold metallo-hydrolase [Actinocorallia sp. A-T 12471]MDX6741878.1 MBL fold metallo-hydrolase [Actinocorallia sp. A-T 12471]
MQLTRFAHACVRFETPEGRVVVDPGAFSGTDPLADADAVLITHLHFDHLQPDALRELRRKRPDLAIYGPPSLAEPLGDLAFTAVRNGDVVEAAGLSFAVVGEEHAVIHRKIPVIENVGYLVDGVFHPGDALTVPDAPVSTLLAPVSAPWLKLGEAADFINEIGPGRVHPIHDALLSDIGTNVTDTILGGLIGAEYVRLGVGESVTF